MLGVASVAQMPILIPASLLGAAILHSFGIAIAGTAASLALFVGGINLADVLFDKHNRRFSKSLKTK